MLEDAVQLAHLGSGLDGCGGLLSCGCVGGGWGITNYAPAVPPQMYSTPPPAVETVPAPRKTSMTNRAKLIVDVPTGLPQVQAGKITPMCLTVAELVFCWGVGVTGLAARFFEHEKKVRRK